MLSLSTWVLYNLPGKIAPRYDDRKSPYLTRTFGVQSVVHSIGQLVQLLVQQLRVLATPLLHFKTCPELIDSSHLTMSLR